MMKKSGAVMIRLAMPDMPARARRVMDSCGVHARIEGVTLDG